MGGGGFGSWGMDGWLYGNFFGLVLDTHTHTHTHSLTLSHTHIPNAFDP